MGPQARRAQRRSWDTPARLGGSVAVVLATLCLGAPPVAGQSATMSPSGPINRQAQIRAERAQVAAALDTSTATLAQIRSALSTLDRNAASQRAALATADRRVWAAAVTVQRLRTQVRSLSRQAVVLKDEMRRRAVAAYVDPPGDAIWAALEDHDYLTVSKRLFFIGLRADTDSKVAANLDQTQSRLGRRQRQASAARRDATAERAKRNHQLDVTRAAEAQQQQLLIRVRATIASQLQRSIHLAATDRALSAQIAAHQAQLQAQLLAAQAPTVTTPTPVDTESPTGGETAPLPPGTTPTTGAPAGVSLCTVGGITINCIIEDQVAELLTAARNDGLNMTGGGYRDPAQQIELRREHCGTTYYAIYEMDPSACHPPTARPGTSQHEVGLAIDFDNSRTHDSVGYKWLAKHAATYGFYNLPSEPWHWSTSGT